MFLVIGFLDRATSFRFLDRLCPSIRNLITVPDNLTICITGSTSFNLGQSTGRTKEAASFTE